jgi:hypothetical protein
MGVRAVLCRQHIDLPLRRVYDPAIANIRPARNVLVADPVLPPDIVVAVRLLGCARKYVALFNHKGGSLVTSLHYFAGLVEEVASMHLNLNYWRYLAARVKKMDVQWRAQAICASSGRKNNRNEIMLTVFPRSLLTHDNHLLHNVPTASPGEAMIVISSE